MNALPRELHLALLRRDRVAGDRWVPLTDVAGPFENPSNCIELTVADAANLFQLTEQSFVLLANLLGHGRRSGGGDQDRKN